MKRFSTILALALVFGAFSFNAQATPDDKKKNDTPAPAMTEVQWQVFSQRLVAALDSDHQGLQQGALRMIIEHGDNLDVDAAVFNVVRLYRNHENPNMRRMAIVALGQMDNKWGNDFLQRSVRFEKSPELRQTILAVLSAQ